ncbi:hypothetical protein DFH29DRAFT_876315 [Suillus ampliporus]|nr:hypothetical protein DFH29DRAFT_876315 [Suillus ampliporus]
MWQKARSKNLNRNWPAHPGTGSVALDEAGRDDALPRIDYFTSIDPSNFMVFQAPLMVVGGCQLVGQTRSSSTGRLTPEGCPFCRSVGRNDSAKQIARKTRFCQAYGRMLKAKNMMSDWRKLWRKDLCSLMIHWLMTHGLFFQLKIPFAWFMSNCKVLRPHPYYAHMAMVWGPGENDAVVMRRPDY